MLDTQCLEAPGECPKVYVPNEAMVIQAAFCMSLKEHFDQFRINLVSDNLAPDNFYRGLILLRKARDLALELIKK